MAEVAANNRVRGGITGPHRAGGGILRRRGRRHRAQPGSAPATAGVGRAGRGAQSRRL
ncbi:hypothetical protein K7G98_05480 [Saccharothrix sp. MB29]|nr:hypothetical protein [Saccharothrix sp. MB29]